MYQNQINTRAHLHTHTLTYTPPHKPVQNVPINENRKQIRSTMLQLKRKKQRKGSGISSFLPHVNTSSMFVNQGQ